MPKKIKEEKNQCIQIVWADTLNEKDFKDLRKLVETALNDPDYVIITNYEIHWEHIFIDKSAACRVVWSDIDGKEVKDLKKQVEKALKDPNYVIITNYPVHWVVVPKI